LEREIDKYEEIIGWLKELDFMKDNPRKVK